MAIAGSLVYDTKIDKGGFDKGLKSLTGSVKNGGAKIKNIVSALGITQIIGKAISTINNSIDGAVSRIDTLNNFPKVMSNLGISSEDSQKAIKKLSDGLQGVPTTLDDASLSVQRFTSVNGNVDKSTEYFLALNNALLAGGASADIQSTAMEQLSQSYAKGKPDMTEWRSIQTAMPAQLKQVADAFNMTTDELGESLRNGEISMDDFMDKIVELNKNGTGEFQSFEEQAKNSTGGIQTSFANMKTAITRGVSKIIEAFDDMLKSNGLGGISTIVNEIGRTAERILKKIASLIPKVVSKIKDIYNWINKNKEALKILIGIIASVTAGFLAYKATLVAIEAIKTTKKILGTASAFLSLIPTIKSAKDAMLLLNMAFNANPVGLVIAGITVLIGIMATLAIAMNDSNKKTQKTFENIGKGASDFVTGISTAKSYLEDFNSTLFASSEEQQKLQQEMSDVQEGITNICRTASDKRRDYTQEEITQLDEYFKKLRELKNRELEIQKSISGAITQQAQQEAQTFQGTLEEYKIKSQEWIKTAEEQRDKQISTINERTTQEIALLQQKYGEKATLDNKEYTREYQAIQNHKGVSINEANDEVAKVNLAYSNGYLERVKQEDGFYSKITEANQKIEAENSRYAEAVKATKESEVFSEEEKNLELLKSKSNHNDKVQKIWKEMYKNMSDEQANEMGIWLQMVAQTELHGGKISDETQEMVDTILKSYDEMPDGAKNKMKETMSGMLKGMQDDEPSLYAKASGIAGGILERLKKSFDIHSPSKKTRKIFNYVMKGAELGLEDEKDSLIKQIDDINNEIYRKMQNAVAMETASINAKASVKANNSMLNVIQAKFNIDGSVAIDGQKAGRILAPSVTKTIKAGGLA